MCHFTSTTTPTQCTVFVLQITPVRTYLNTHSICEICLVTPSAVVFSHILHVYLLLPIVTKVIRHVQ